MRRPKMLLSVDELSLKKFTSTVGSHARWVVLRELGRGEALPVSLLAAKAKVTGTAMSKHLEVLRDAGLVLVGYGRLYKLAPQIKIDAEKGLVDLGYCLLRM